MPPKQPLLTGLLLVLYPELRKIFQIPALRHTFSTWSPQSQIFFRSWLGRVENNAFTFYTSGLLSVRRHCPVFSPNTSFKESLWITGNRHSSVKKRCFGKKYFSRKRYFNYLFFYLRPFQYARPCVQVTKPQVPRFFLLDEVFIAFKLLMMIVFSDLKLFSCVIGIKSFKLSKLFSVICACLK